MIVTTWQVHSFDVKPRSGYSRTLPLCRIVQHRRIERGERGAANELDGVHVTTGATHSRTSPDATSPGSDVITRSIRSALGS